MQEGVISTDNAVIAEKKDGDGVKPFDTVTIYATKKAGFIKAGEKWVVHPVLAAKLIASGKATEKSPKKGDSEEAPAE
jgi:hypothetical protein